MVYVRVYGVNTIQSMHVGRRLLKFGRKWPRIVKVVRVGVKVTIPKQKNDHFLSHLLGLRGTSQPKMLHKIHFIYAMHAHDGSFQNFVQL